MRYALRLISFASATACAIFSLIGVFLLLTGCNYAHHRFPPSVKILVFPTILIGVGFFISAFVYRWFIQNSTKPPSRPSLPNLIRAPFDANRFQAVSDFPSPFCT